MCLLALITRRSSHTIPFISKRSVRITATKNVQGENKNRDINISDIQPVCATPKPSPLPATDRDLWWQVRASQQYLKCDVTPNQTSDNRQVKFEIEVCIHARKMFWNICCCGRSQNNSSVEMSNSSSSVKNESQNTQISEIDASGEENNTGVGHRTRTDTQSSGTSMHSVKSFYSARSVGSKDEGDFYSVCSVESYKST